MCDFVMRAEEVANAAVALCGGQVLTAASPSLTT